ncbi:hypothetical protein, partial [Microseira wollei]|uniref:hypothetical protein n=1 Tax=Microseira wollei TaxID=467598 RepID=UPI001CFE6507
LLSVIMSFAWFGRPKSSQIFTISQVLQRFREIWADFLSLLSAPALTSLNEMLKHLPEQPDR